MLHKFSCLFLRLKGGIYEQIFCIILLVGSTCTHYGAVRGVSKGACSDSAAKCAQKKFRSGGAYPPGFHSVHVLDSTHSGAVAVGCRSSTLTLNA